MNKNKFDKPLFISMITICALMIFASFTFVLGAIIGVKIIPVGAIFLLLAIAGLPVLLICYILWSREEFK